jgi:hypothetical protein
MVGKLLLGGVAATLRRIGRAVEIAHVSQQVAVGALRYGGTEVQAEPPVSEAQIVFSIALGRETAQHLEA